MADHVDTPPTFPSNLPVLPLRRAVLLPLTVQPLAVNRPLAVEAINRALSGDRLVLVLQQQSDAEDATPHELARVGTIGAIRQMVKADGGLRVLVEGLTRARAEFFNPDDHTIRALLVPLPETFERSIDVDARVRRVHDLVDRAMALATGLSPEVRALIADIDDPLRLVYLLSTMLDMKADDRQRLLEEDSVIVKLDAIAGVLTREISVLELKGQIESQAQQEMSDAQRQYVLRQQLKTIQAELGEGEAPELAELRRRIDEAKLPEPVDKAARHEVDRLERMTSASPEYQMIRTYLDWVLEIPWAVTTEDRLDLAEARRVLDEDHYDLDKVKERIIEYLAVRKLKGDLKGPILCFVGPPGVGKTSLGQSIARAMTRRFVRVSLGGVRDEAEIRGHRRTYIGALPGRVVQALRQAASANPVFMLDEIDKLAVGFQGDPAAALLEVLDPAQNHAFRDHYLEVPIDLSRVLFIATANQLGPVHPALLDRMEIISLTGYSEDEKVHIARRYLIPRQTAEHGLPDASIDLQDDALRRVIREYTREAGVRNVERQIGTIARKIAARVASAPSPGSSGTAATGAAGEARAEPAAISPPASGRFVVTVGELPEYLGPPRFQDEVEFRTSRPGVATGVAWTETGGDVLFIEAQLLPSGNGALTLTGQLGNVMQESARAAVSHIRANAAALGIAPDFLKGYDLHVHVPAGAIPKDGPSAGVTLATAILSAVRNQAVRQDVAMTGEITLSGLVLPVGGIREKALAATRHGIRTFVLPAQNLDATSELPEEIRQEMTFVPVRTLEEVLEVALPSATTKAS